MNARVKRVLKDIAEVVNAKLDYFQELKQVDDSNNLIWTGLLLPTEAPFNSGAFRIRIEFTTDYPFKNPAIRFQTPIYHPNVDEKGTPCLPILTEEGWRPNLRFLNAITALHDLIKKPELDRPVRPEIAKIYHTNLKKFQKNAEAHCKKHAEKRPPRK